MEKLIFKNYLESLPPNDLFDIIKRNPDIMDNFVRLEKLTRLKYPKGSLKYNLKMKAIKNAFTDKQMTHLFYSSRKDKNKINDSLLKYHKDENYKKYNFKKHFPNNYYQMFYYFTRKGINRFCSEQARDFYIRTGKEPYEFCLSREKKILVNDICHT